MKQKAEKQQKHKNSGHTAAAAERKRKRHSGGLVLVLLCVALLAAGVLAVRASRRSATSLPGEAPPVRSLFKSIAESTEIMRQAKELKKDYRTLAELIREQKVSEAAEQLKTAEEDIRALEDCMNDPLYQAAEVIPAFREEMDAARELLDIARTANKSLIDPLLQLMERCPLSEIKAETGFRADYAVSYLDFAESAFPVARDLMERMNGVDGHVLELADSDGKLRKISAEFSELISEAEPYVEYLPLLRAFLGEGEDRFYLFAAQNTAEIRASGGFPGAVGGLEIRDGLLSFVDFRDVYSVFNYGLPSGVQLSQTEKTLFQGRMDLAWDADFSPDFERVAEIWAKAYESKNGIPVDGVLSATPVIIQRLLSFLGEITLSDGTVLDGENAMRVLGHDLYFRYFSRRAGGNIAESNRVTDELFAETAKKTLELLISTAGVGHLRDYLDFTEECFSDRTLMLWMAREEEQAAVRRMGWAGTLNQDETKPQIGVFFNCTDASKMGWFLDIDVEIGEGATDGSGAKTYPVTVRFSNRITPEERRTAGRYILGTAGGSGGIAGSLYLFAPAGGKISNCRVSSGQMQSASYRGLSLVWQSLIIRPESSVVIECDVTTAPTAESPLTLMQTPTAQNYRN